MRYNYLLLSDLLRSKRLERGYYIRGLARIIGISDTELSRIENGERKNFNLVTLINMCEVLRIDFIKLLKEFKKLPYEYGVAIGFSMINDDLKLIEDAFNEATLMMRKNKSAFEDSNEK